MVHIYGALCLKACMKLMHAWLSTAEPRATSNVHGRPRECERSAACMAAEVAGKHTHTYTKWARNTASRQMMSDDDTAAQLDRG